MSALIEFTKDQYAHLPIVPTPKDCNGKTYIVTGANTGLGYECAKHLVRLTAKRVILAVRSLNRGEGAKAKIEADTGIKGVAEVWHLDLSSYDSVKTFAKKVQGLERVDAIIENATIIFDKRTTSEGLETCLTVNVVSTFLLALLVLPKLEETAKKFNVVPHLVVVGSGAGFGAKGQLEKIDGDIIDGLNKTNMSNRYPETKLLQLYATRQLAELRPVEKTGVVTNYLSPGFCRTELARHVSWTLQLMIGLMRLVWARTAEAGSRTLLHAMVAGKESHGKYISSCEIREDKVEPWVIDDAGRKMQGRVWNSLTKKLNTIQPGCV